MLESFKRRIEREWGKTKLKALNTLLPEAEPESWSDLKREKLEHEVKVGHKITPAAPTATPQPVYRRGGQIHNFSAAPPPERYGRRLTRAQYEARYQGHRPVPHFNVGTFNTTPEGAK